jgi:subtilisin family serine protease
MRRPTRPRLEALEARVNPVRISALAGQVLGDFTQPHTATEIMATIRSEDAIGELNRAVASDARGRNLIDPAASQVIFTMDGRSLVEVRLAANADPAAAARWLASQRRVVWTEPNAVFVGNPMDFTPNDPQFSGQYHLPLMDLPEAWDIETGNPAIVLAITDNGTAINHPDLAQNIWVNADEIPGNSIDDDGNGFIDDIRGWDFNAPDNDPNPVGSANHGTHTAGIAAAVTNNAVGVSGVAGGNGSANSGIRIMPIRWEGANGWTASHVAQSFTYAANNGAKIVSASYVFDGWVGNGTVISAWDYSYSLGVLHFNSAGNNNQLNPPRGVFEQCLFVTSTDANDVKSSFSNYGVFADIAAPGTSVLATSASSSGTVFNYATLSGTSMSTPNAAAVAALIWSEHPTWTREQVVAQLLATADNIDGINPTYAGLLGTGRANANRALTETIPPPRIGTVTGLPSAGGLTETAPTSLSIIQEMRFDPATVVASSFELRGDGPDNAFNTADDILVPLTLTAGATYRIGTNTLTLTIGSMPLDRYRFIAKSSALEDPFGTALDGDGNGTAGGDYIHE